MATTAARQQPPYPPKANSRFWLLPNKPTVQHWRDTCTDLRCQVSWQKEAIGADHFADLCPQSIHSTKPVVSQGFKIVRPAIPSGGEESRAEKSPVLIVVFLDTAIFTANFIFLSSVPPVGIGCAFRGQSSGGRQSTEYHRHPNKPNCRAGYLYKLKTNEKEQNYGQRRLHAD